MTLVKPSSENPRATARVRTQVLGMGSKHANQYTTAPLGGAFGTVGQEMFADFADFDKTAKISFQRIQFL